MNLEDDGIASRRSGGSMKNAKDILQQKEADLVRVRREVASLKIVAALLADDDSKVEDLNLTSDGLAGKLLTNAEETIDAPPEATGTHGLFSSFSDQLPKRWNVLKRHS
jgi:hypothetical protein